MTVFVPHILLMHDDGFEGWLTAVFTAYELKHLCSLFGMARHKPFAI